MNAARTFFAVIVSLASATAMGQQHDDGHGNVFNIVVSPKVGVIQYSASALNHATGVTGTQIVQFAITLTLVKKADGWTIPEIDWINDSNVSGFSAAPGYVVITSSVHNYVATGEVYASGSYQASVSVHLVDPNGHEHDGLWTAKVAAIGGPITISVRHAVQPTWTNDGGDTTKPFFLEYFG